MAAPDGTPLDDVVVGAGFCGLSAAAALRRYRVPSLLLFEQGPYVAAWWAGNYDRIRLHGARESRS